MPAKDIKQLKVAVETWQAPLTDKFNQSMTVWNQQVEELLQAQSLQLPASFQYRYNKNQNNTAITKEDRLLKALDFLEKKRNSQPNQSFQDQDQSLLRQLQDLKTAKPDVSAAEALASLLLNDKCEFNVLNKALQIETKNGKTKLENISSAPSDQESGQVQDQTQDFSALKKLFVAREMDRLNRDVVKTRLKIFNPLGLKTTPLWIKIKTTQNPEQHAENLDALSKIGENGCLDDDDYTAILKKAGNESPKFLDALSKDLLSKVVVNAKITDRDSIKNIFDSEDALTKLSADDLTKIIPHAKPKDFVAIHENREATNPKVVESIFDRIKNPNDKDFGSEKLSDKDILMIINNSSDDLKIRATEDEGLAGKILRANEIFMIRRDKQTLGKMPVEGLKNLINHAKDNTQLQKICEAAIEQDDPKSHEVLQAAISKSKECNSNKGTKDLLKSILITGGAIAKLFGFGAVNERFINRIPEQSTLKNLGDLLNQSGVEFKDSQPVMGKIAERLLEIGSGSQGAQVDKSRAEALQRFEQNMPSSQPAGNTKDAIIQTDFLGKAPYKMNNEAVLLASNDTKLATYNNGDLSFDDPKGDSGKLSDEQITLLADALLSVENNPDDSSKAVTLEHFQPEDIKRLATRLKGKLETEPTVDIPNITISGDNNVESLNRVLTEASNSRSSLDMTGTSSPSPTTGAGGGPGL
jgi:hypothetical protein